jgi:hypothetical protein
MQNSTLGFCLVNAHEDWVESTSITLLAARGSLASPLGMHVNACWNLHNRHYNYSDSSLAS